MFTSETEMNNSLSFLDIKLLEKTTNSLSQFMASLYSVVRLLNLRVLYLIRTNTT